MTSDEKYAIIAAAYKGLMIARVESDYSLTILSQVKVLGSMFNIMLMQND